MDQMDTTHIIDVPDTPDRLTTRLISESHRNGMKEENNSSSSRNQKLLDGTKNQPMVIDGGSKRSSLRLPKGGSSTSQSLHPKKTKGPTEKSTSCQNHDSVRPQKLKQIERPSHSSNSSPSLNLDRKRSSLSSHGPKDVSTGLADAGEGTNNVSRVGVAHIPSPRVNRQRKLVRNGCISPNNIAKAKQPSPIKINNNNTSVTSSAPPVPIDILELVSEDNTSYTRKGKGVLTQPCSSKEPDLNNFKDLLNRSSMGINDKAKEINTTDESNGWISTHNHTRRMNPNLTSSMQACMQPSRQSEPNSSTVRTRPLNGHHSSSRTAKRQKLGSNLSSTGECSTSTTVSDDPEVVFLNSYKEPSVSRSTPSSVNNLQPIIEIDELSPDTRRNPREDNARSRQVEADELLARELQEQLYSEVPVRGAGERGGHRSNIHRQPQPRSVSRNPRRGRGSNLRRLTSQRSRFPGQPRFLLPSTGGVSMFPANMDLETRMQLLEAFETSGELEVPPFILQSHRDFNENDYEMLLALDENNGRHSGAPVHRINGLPQSTVQNENFDEACAICLDTPTIGDTIRHLPCLHKFHKDCIDPWLRRKTSCPVCKSSVVT